MKNCCTSPIMRSANSVEKMQVFCAWSSLRMSACTVPRTSDSVSLRICSYVSAIEQLVARHAEQAEARAVVVRRQLALVGRPRPVAGTARRSSAPPPPTGPWLAQVLLDALVDRGVHEHREDHRRRAVDRHRHRGRRRAEIEARVELLHVVERRDRDAGVADAAVDVRTLVRVLAVQRRRIEGRREARGAVPARDVMEAAVGALGRTLAREHARRVLFLAAVRVDARRVGKLPRQVLLQQERQLLAPVAEARHRELGHAVVAQRRHVVVAADLACRAPCT